MRDESQGAPWKGSRGVTRCQGAVTSQGQRSLWWKKKSGLLRSKRDHELLDLRGKRKTSIFLTSVFLNLCMLAIFLHPFFIFPIIALFFFFLQCISAVWMAHLSKGFRCVTFFFFAPRVIGCVYVSTKCNNMCVCVFRKTKCTCGAFLLTCLWKNQWEKVVSEDVSVGRIQIGNKTS